MHPEETKDQFYEELDTIISRVFKSDKLIILGDFKNRFGTHYSHGQEQYYSMVQVNVIATASSS